MAEKGKVIKLEVDEEEEDLEEILVEEEEDEEMEEETEGADPLIRLSMFFPQQK